METNSSHSDIWNLQVISTEKGSIYSSIDLLIKFIFLFKDKYIKDYQEIFKETGQEVGLSYSNSCVCTCTTYVCTLIKYIGFCVLKFRFRVP